MSNELEILPCGTCRYKLLDKPQRVAVLRIRTTLPSMSLVLRLSPDKVLNVKGGILPASVLARFAAIS